MQKYTRSEFVCFRCFFLPARVGVKEKLRKSGGRVSQDPMISKQILIKIDVNICKVSAQKSQPVRCNVYQYWIISRASNKS